MIRSEIEQLKTGPRELRNFGLLVGGAFVALGAWPLYKPASHLKPASPYLLAAGVLLMLFGLLAPRALKHIYIAWMSLAIVMGFVVSRILLTLFFFLVVTPFGFVARCSGKDFLGLKLNPNAASYWLPREKKSRKQEDYERQF